MVNVIKQHDLGYPLMKVTLLGTGTSQGVPVIGCKCDVCLSEDHRDKRLRSSVFIEVNGVNVVVDTGPDFRTQMLRAGVESLDAILFTHEHKDHVAGLDDVRAFNQINGLAMQVWASHDVESALKRDFHYAFGESKHGGLPKILINQLGELEENIGITVGGIDVVLLPVMHGKMKVMGFRVGDFAYVTDVNYIPDSTFEKMVGVKVLVISALRKKRHPSHFTLDEVLSVVERINPVATYLTHLSHFIGKHEDLACELPEGVFVGFDGLVIENN
tara:strand:- start:2132 stop:2950 length:819 start_codon:yes stop_codon:yes gene_type:complete